MQARVLHDADSADDSGVENDNDRGVGETFPYRVGFPTSDRELLRSHSERQSIDRDCFEMQVVLRCCCCCCCYMCLSSSPFLSPNLFLALWPQPSILRPLVCCNTYPGVREYKVA